MNEKRMLEEFFELVRLPAETRKERQVADAVKRKLEALGAAVHEDDAGRKIGGDAGNVFGFIKGTKEGATPVMLCAHMDSVPPATGIEPVIRDGIITSKGNTVLGGDDKVGIAAILEALRVLKEENVPHGDIQAVFTVSEEVGLGGSGNIDAVMLKAQIGYVLDGDGAPGTITTAAPSQYSIKSVFHGRTAHAGVAPEEGCNAIVMAAKAIAAAPDGRIDPETTCNIGVIEGGKATNIVPDLCTVNSEARSRDDEKLEKLVARIKETFEKTAKDCGGTVEVALNRTSYSYQFKETDDVVAKAVDAAKGLGFNVICQGSGGGTDANNFNRLGVSAAVLGTGMGKIHTTEEFLRERDLYDTARWIVEIIKQYAA